MAHLQLTRHDGTHRQQGAWKLRFESACWQQPALVSGLQQSCWEMLQALARRERLRFCGVATPFQLLLKHCGRARPENALFITISAHQCRIARRIHHVWHEVSTLSLPHQAMHAQLRVITRLSGMADCPHFVLDTEEGEPQIITPQESKV